MIKLKDALMSGWDSWVLSGKVASIKYTHINNGTYQWKTPTFITASNGGTSLGCGYTFNSAIEDNNYYASEGYETFTMDASGKKDMLATGLYADRSVSVTPTISFSLSGTSVSISVSNTSTEYVDAADARVTIK